MNNTRKIELYYDCGGHGGPYIDDAEARAAAVRLILGCRTINRIDLIDRSTGKKIETVHREDIPF